MKARILASVHFWASEGRIQHLVVILRNEVNLFDRLENTDTGKSLLRTGIAENNIEQSIGRRFERQVAQSPQNVAIVCGLDSCTYSELNKRVNRIAHTLIRRRQVRDTRTALLLDRNIDLVAAAFASIKSGSCYVPLDSTHPDKRNSFVLNDCDAEMILCNSRNLDKARTLSGGRATVINIESVDTDSPNGNPTIEVDPDAHSYILYTSGSTGRPKGVIQNHRNVLHFTMKLTRLLNVTPSDRFTLLSSFSYVAAANDLFPSLLNGSCLCMYNFGSEQLRLCEWIEDQKITVYNSVPTLFRFLINDLTADCTLSNLRVVKIGGEPVLASDVMKYKEHFPDNCIFIVSYGSTELNGIRFNKITKSTPIDTATVAAGYKAEDTEVIILDELDNELLIGQIGEIAVRTKYCALGYVNNEKLSKTVFKVDKHSPDTRVYHTGDRGYINDVGCLVNIGRADNQIKIRGHRVELSEIESALTSHPAISQAAVRLHENKHRIGYLVAYLIAAANGSVDDSKIRSYLETILPSFMIPARFHTVQKLPLTHSGKLDRQNIARQLERRSSPPLSAPETNIQWIISRIWRDELSLSTIGIDDNFLALGGDSLKAACILARLERLSGKKLPLEVMQTTPTIRLLAERHELDQWQHPITTLMPIKKSGDKPPLFCIHGVGGHIFHFFSLGPHMPPDRPLYGLRKNAAIPESIERMAERYIHEIRAVQPTGPYFIAGYSFGGIIAFEMAQRLSIVGNSPSLTILIDSDPPVTPFDLRRIKNVIKKKIKYELKKIPFVRNIIRRLIPLLTSRRPHANAAWRKPHEEIIKANRRAYAQYRARPYSGKVVMLCSEARKDLYRGNASLGWQKYCANLKTEIVGMGHLDMYSTQHAQKFAKKLIEIIESAF